MSPAAAGPAPVRVAVLGAAGRMGRKVMQRLALQPDLRLAAALDAKAAQLDGGIVTSADPAVGLAHADVAIDFTAPPSVATLLPLCVARRVAYVLASTGLGPTDEAAVRQAQAAIPIVVASNFSVGVNLLLELAELAAKRLGQSFDVEIAEIHHRQKRDAPSGTAHSIGQAVARGRGPLRDVLGRAGTEPPRDPEQLGYAALRGGDVSGEHTVYFFGDGERLELTHRAGTPDIFADGALRAARWVVGKPPGRYSMKDVLAG